MNRKISLGAAIAFAAIIAGVTFCITIKFSMDTFNSMTYRFDENGEIIAKLSKIDSIINKNYVGEINQEDILDAIAEGYISGLNDRFSAYYDASELEELKNSSNGQIVNIGFVTALDESGYMRVIKVYEDSPAAESGILKNDLITSINENNILQTGYQQALALVRDLDDETIKIGVRREGRDYTLLIRRREVVIPSVEYSLEGTNGYIRIFEFNGATFEHFKDAVEELTDKGATGFIFDLRDNHGGTLDAVTKMLDYLLPEGVIVTMDYADGTTDERRSAPGEINMPMVTITNANTASAAELFVAALKDYNKAKQIGITTYGKGVMQDLFYLNDGSAVNLTVAYFNPPTSPNFHEKGVVPDFEIALTDEALKLHATYDLLLENDSQFLKAVEVVDSAK